MLAEPRSPRARRRATRRAMIWCELSTVTGRLGRAMHAMVLAQSPGLAAVGRDFAAPDEVLVGNVAEGPTHATLGAVGVQRDSAVFLAAFQHGHGLGDR